MMKRILILLLLAVFAAGNIAAQTSPAKTDETTTENTDGPKASWDKLIYEMGEVTFMVSKDAEFKVTNTGNQPLVITSARASCGCTNLKYSKEPILPGASATLAVTFNGAGNGQFRKTITVQTNEGTKSTVLQIAGTVVKPQQ